MRLTLNCIADHFAARDESRPMTHVVELFTADGAPHMLFVCGECAAGWPTAVEVADVAGSSPAVWPDWAVRAALKAAAS